MTARPRTVTELAAESALARTVLTWQPVGWEPLIDHYRVYATRGEHRRWRPSEADLLGKTVYPRFVHDGQDPAGEQWTYVVSAVSDAGAVSRPSDALAAASLPSVTATGREVARIGDFDGKSLEFRFAPAGYAQIPTTYPDALVEHVQGRDTPAGSWPYLLPGPGDAWAGGKAYTALWHLALDEAPSQHHDLALWLIDTTRLGGRLEVDVNGTRVQDVDVVPGATRGSRDGDATVPGSTLVRSFHEFAVPASTLRAGENTIRFRMATGGWVAWDAIGLYARS
ncbi:polysaccharide lyase family protein [Kineococcus sp. SYSU DK018]|uniref:polysaccharide lyase family protein n=1 Tax=Kineococcus sp. SYSU DK018 TaxID=3383139 RepID=UPI003D7CB7CD